jgi:hypothetical protein
VLEEEAARLWTPYGVDIAWSDTGPPTGCHAAPRTTEGPENHIHVLILAGNPLDDFAAPTFHLASLTRQRPGDAPARPTTLILTTVERARHLVDVALRADGGAVRHPAVERLTALVLGRAIAHELGHYLLGPAHAAHGLMRSRFGRGDVLFAATRRFELDNGQVARLSGVIARGADGDTADPIVEPRTGPATPDAGPRHPPQTGSLRRPGS